MADARKKSRTAQVRASVDLPVPTAELRQVPTQKRRRDAAGPIAASGYKLTLVRVRVTYS